DLLGRGLARDVIDGDVGAFLRESQRDGAPDTARSSGDERGAPFELHENHLLWAWIVSLARRVEAKVLTRSVTPFIVTFKGHPVEECHGVRHQAVLEQKALRHAGESVRHPRGS